MKRCLRAGALSVLSILIITAHAQADFWPGGRDGFLRRNSAAANTEWYDRAEQGDPRAQYNLAILYYKGDGIRQSFRKAKKYFKLAADQGLPAAQTNVGIMYIRGQGGDVNYYEGFNYLKSAAEFGHAKAQLYVATLYAQGLGVEANDERAEYWYARAAEQGLSRHTTKIALTK